ncbi:hypothetical protein KNP414_07944 [Paenibacillus mucilaginosus KNP414]|uniref:Uncharacterized protein n=1 Tax=Paenibacillus mucilaginosus (strain KNP414) TaxID=1036673 RepID=F8FKR1_PAEMK|nr:hypothetical protein KNP414_07944 [Paenibacillus mucilaginosus KNP414]
MGGEPGFYPNGRLFFAKNSAAAVSYEGVRKTAQGFTYEPRACG